MYNDFVLVGPAAIRRHQGQRHRCGADKIAGSKASFVSRGDKSGTHAAELRYWKAAASTRQREDGRLQGMRLRHGPALNIASSSDAYVLADRGTWLSFKNRGNLAILVEGDKRLFNQYGVIVVNPAKHPHVKKELAQAFADWVLSPRRPAHDRELQDRRRAAVLSERAEVKRRVASAAGRRRRWPRPAACAARLRCRVVRRPRAVVAGPGRAEAARFSSRDDPAPQRLRVGAAVAPVQPRQRRQPLGMLGPALAPVEAPAQCPSPSPGRFMRCSPPRPSTSCSGTMAVSATDARAARIRSQWISRPSVPRYARTCARSCSVAEAHQPSVVSLSCVPV
jgi:hypothetical protein